MDDEGILIELTDEDGNAFQMEIVGRVEYEDETYVVFLPADMDENDPDYGFVILRSSEQDAMEVFDSVDDEELLEKVYAIYMEEVFSEEDDSAEQ
ncbi:MAG: DUF1292 domain-containing protein [Oscillospiraceae bacterium]|nr:DUF1292 domain-containing protein [Oscillospiraceae bacterium]MCD8191272.1 DUF1292 domain-containing protein [Oscillospiraceae bacterium]